ERFTAGPAEQGLAAGDRARSAHDDVARVEHEESGVERRRAGEVQRAAAGGGDAELIAGTGGEGAGVRGGAGRDVEAVVAGRVAQHVVRDRHAVVQLERTAVDRDRPGAEGRVVARAEVAG